MAAGLGTLMVVNAIHLTLARGLQLAGATFLGLWNYLSFIADQLAQQEPRR